MTEMTVTEPQTYRIFWIAVGGYEVEIDVFVQSGRILVTGDTRDLMAESILDAGLADEESDKQYADDIMSAAESDGFLYDVTEFGGGFMQEQLAEDYGITEVDKAF